MDQTNQKWGDQEKWFHETEHVQMYKLDEMKDQDIYNLLSEKGNPKRCKEQIWVGVCVYYME